jgi:hypothetical protein
MNEYESRQEERRQRYLALADKHDKLASAAHRRARDAVAGIPFGQPILVGHHSEGRHRAALKRQDNAMQASIDHDKKAAYYRGKAAGVDHAGISSDDPDAVVKLLEKIEAAEASQKNMKAANRILRSKKLDDEGKVAALVEMGFSEATARRTMEPDFAGRPGFPAYMLSNNNANIRRMKARVEELRAAADREYTESAPVDGLKVIEDPDLNRLQLVFDGKPPADVRAVLKRNGFRWAPSQGAWQRHLNNGARYAAEQVVAALA